MPEKEMNLTEELFSNILDSLIQKQDGNYIFRDGKLTHRASIIINSDRYEEDLKTITVESICRYFEDKIVSKIPNTILIIKGNYLIEVIINTDQKLIQRFLNAKKQIDIYESYKTLFFPTLKEVLIKFGKSPQKWIYYPEKSYKADIYPLEKDPTKKDIRFVSSHMIRYGFSDKFAIELLMEDINYYIRNLKFHNPVPIDVIELPQRNLSIQDLKLKIKVHRKGGFIDFEYYSYEQQIKFIKKLFEDFLEYYQKIIEKNFPRIKNSFILYSNQPIKITIYTREHLNPYTNSEDLTVEYSIDKLNDNNKNQIELIENNTLEYDEKYLYARSTGFSHLLNIDSFSTSKLSIDYIRETSGNFKYSEISKLNALPFVYSFIYEELGDIIEKIAEDTIFDEIKPYITPIESWVSRILEAEKKGGEDYYIELKLIPKASEKGDGSGNDLYGHINAFENGRGGYIFIGIDEKKKGIDKIVGLEGYMRDNKKTLDMVKREIFDNCLKFLKKATYKLDADNYKGRSLIRIEIPSNNGDVSLFYPESGGFLAYIRENGRKRPMLEQEFKERIRKFAKGS